MSAAPNWVDGRIVPAGDPWPGDSARAAAGDCCCYTTARISQGRPWWPDQHAQRLCRDARTLGIGDIDPRQAERALWELGAACFSRSDGIVRVQVQRAGGRPRLLGTARVLGAEPDAWSAKLFAEAHPGPSPWSGAKRSDAFLERARATARCAGVDEVLLADREGRLVEGARSNLLWVDEAGALWALPPARGGVAGVALARLCELLPPIPERDLNAADLPTVRELIAVNAVRGARAVVRVDDRPVGCDHAVAWAPRLAEALRASAIDSASPPMG